MDDLIKSLERLIALFSDSQMNLAFEEYSRVKIVFEKCNMDKKKCAAELEMLISAASAPQGLQDMCPMGVDYGEWLNLVHDVKTHAVKTLNILR